MFYFPVFNLVNNTLQSSIRMLFNMQAKILISTTLLVATLGLATGATDKIICYHGTWSVYRPGNGTFTVDNIDPSLCTHLIYAFVGVNENGSLVTLDTFLDVNKGNLEAFVNLKKKNPKLKVLVGMGGWNEGSVKYSKISASAELRSVLVNTTVEFMQKYGFDGLDFDWEYPAQRNGSADDVVNYITLLRELKAAFKPHGLLLSAAVASTATSVDTSYNVPAMSEILDWISILSYDLHGAWDGVTGQNAPLFPSSKDTTEAAKQLNVAAALKVWLDRGADPSKMVLGLATYGRSFSLKSTKYQGIGAVSDGPGTAGPYTREAGVLGYNEICELKINRPFFREEWDDEQKVPYGLLGDQWVGYDNPRSISIKVKYAVSQKLGGVMVWTVETDDFKGLCGKKNPLLNAINDVIVSAS